jgi:hypothetical protein
VHLFHHQLLFSDAVHPPRQKLSRFHACVQKIHNPGVPTEPAIHSIAITSTLQDKRVPAGYHRRPDQVEPDAEAKKSKDYVTTARLWKPHANEYDPEPEHYPE